jgi:hypothetical protein
MTEHSIYTALLQLTSCLCCILRHFTNKHQLLDKLNVVWKTIQGNKAFSSIPFIYSHDSQISKEYIVFRSNI